MTRNKKTKDGKETFELVQPALEEVLNGVFAGMPCSNRVSAAEKAAFDRYLAKGADALERRNLRKLKILKSQD